MVSTRHIARSAFLAVALQLPAGTAVFTETPKTVTRRRGLWEPPLEL